MSALTLDFIAQRMNGEIRGNQVACPGPGHSPKDRSLCIKVEPAAPAGLVVYSHAQDDNLKCKDFVLRQLGLEPFRPRHAAANANQKIPARLAGRRGCRSAFGSFRLPLVIPSPRIRALASVCCRDLRLQGCQRQIALSGRSLRPEGLQASPAGRQGRMDIQGH